MRLCSHLATLKQKCIYYDLHCCMYILATAVYMTSKIKLSDCFMLLGAQVPKLFNTFFRPCGSAKKKLPLINATVASKIPIDAFPFQAKMLK